MCSGGYGVATGGPFAWGLCYNKELSPSQSYCDDSFKYTYPCSPGVDYYGRGAIPIYWYVYTESLTHLFLCLFVLVSYKPCRGLDSVCVCMSRLI